MEDAPELLIQSVKEETGDLTSRHKGDGRTSAIFQLQQRGKVHVQRIVQCSGAVLRDCRTSIADGVVFSKFVKYDGFCTSSVSMCPR